MAGLRYQNVAEVAEGLAGGSALEGGRGHSKGLAESTAEMTMTGKAQPQCNRCHFLRPIGNRFKRGAQANLGKVVVERIARLLAEDAAEVIR